MASLIVENASKALIVTKQGGYEAVSPISAFIDKALSFTGVFNLNNPYGMFWNDYTQIGALTFTVGGAPIIGGCDRVKITANGSAITVPSNWVNIGTDAIDTTNGAINILYAVQAPSGQVDYVVKVI